MCDLVADYNRVMDSEGGPLVHRCSDDASPLSPPFSHHNHRDELRRWDFGSEMRGILLGPARKERKTLMHIATAGIGMAKYVFLFDGIDARGRAVLSNQPIS